MGNTWGRKVPLKEVLRKNKREINKAVRELDRERANLEKQEQKLVADIKKYAKDGQMGPVKIMAKDLVRTRTYITKFIGTPSRRSASSAGARRRPHLTISPRRRRPRRRGGQNHYLVSVPGGRSSGASGR